MGRPVAVRHFCPRAKAKRRRGSGRFSASRTIRRRKVIPTSGRFTGTNIITLIPLDQYRTSVLFYLYVNVLEKNTETGDAQPAGGDAGRFSPGSMISTATSGCKFSRRLKLFCRPTAASCAIGRRCGRFGGRKKIRAPGQTASHCYGIFTAARRRRQHKKISLLFGLFQYQRDGEITGRVCFT